ncbi:SH3 domain-containing protein LALA0_S06e06678g [Lachancea lanzarotensis]|uniref:LALA0S06e06678g1_1 n=1 Tax=Lachancea lanzarotensis TaxID=1245769 RepID=A0A0C7MYS3_9SACH|nr:uncharacterized protein LALA0_S06e06678g [Lachancea lanzarotensis]CEP62911.1 LALA0S06e06678g1_1 [Lachancea lanzarotensis]
MSASSINRSLATVKTELEFLQESNVISQQAFQDIMAALPERYSPEEARRETPSTTAASQNEFVEAVYAFQAQQDGDLDFHVGDKIEVLEKPSPEWFKGRCNGKVGMFPSNYVKPAFSGSLGQGTDRLNSLAPPPPQYQPQAQQQLQLQPQQTNASAHSSYSQPQFPPPSTNYYQNPPQQQYQNQMQQAYYQSPPPMQQQPVQEQQQQQQHHAGSQAFKKFGSKLGNAAIFGAGATIGSDIVNGIF